VVRDAFSPTWVRERCSMLQQRGVAAFQRARGAAAPAGRQGLQTIKETSRKTFARLRATPWLALARRHWKLLLIIGPAGGKLRSDVIVGNSLPALMIRTSFTPVGSDTR
jgi:hypothetical protein